MAGTWVLPEAQQWHKSVRELAAAREADAQRRREDVADKDAEVERWRQTAATMQANRDDAEQKAREAELDATRLVNEIKWASVQQVTEYEDRISILEKLLEEERQARARELERQAALMKQIREEAEDRVREVERRCNASVAAANARAREAMELSEFERRRAAEEVKLARAREESRVSEIRQQTDAHIRNFEESKRFELEQMHYRVIGRQRAMEETLYANGRPKSEVLATARQHATAMEQDFKELRLAQATDRALKEGRPGAQKALLDLEKTLHKRTMDRAMGRASASLPCHQDQAASGGGFGTASFAGATSPFARVGGTMIAE